MDQAEGWAGTKFIAQEGFLAFRCRGGRKEIGTWIGGRGVGRGRLGEALKHHVPDCMVMMCGKGGGRGAAAWRS